MSMTFDQDDLQMFQEEAQEHLETLEQGLLTLESQLGDEPDKELLNEMFRGAHSIKGAAGMLGFKAIASLTHQLENLLGVIREGKLPFSRPAADALFEAVDVLRTLLLEVQSGGHAAEFDISSTVATLREILEGPVPAAIAPVAQPAAPAPAAAAPAALQWAFAPCFEPLLTPAMRAQLPAIDAEGVYLYEVDLDLPEVRWGENGLDHLVVEKLESLGTVLALHTEAPLPARTEAGTFSVQGKALFTTSAEPTIMGILLPLAPQAIQLVPQAPIAIAKPAAEAPAAEAAPAAKAAPARAEAPEKQEAPKRAPSQASIRVDVERLDLLMDVVGELVIGHTRVSQISADLESRYEREPLVGTLNETLAQVSRLMSELQLTVMRTRMVPVERVFSKFNRLARDLSKSLGKEIRLEISGQDTELDKTVVEELEDPLVHLVRNAADHGVEKPDARAEKGKPREGTIRLSAAREGNHIVLTIADDGAGIDPSKVLAKAIKQGLASPDVNYSEADIFQFIFQPGFSTAEAVTDVSGRGVGMDVVNQNIRKIKGTILVSSKVGEGTTIQIKLPLTLAITKALLIKAGGDAFAIPLDAVRESIRVAEGDIKTINKREVVQLRGRVVPLVNLARVFGLKPSQTGRTRPVVIVGDEHHPFGLVVDSLEGEQDVVIKSLGDFLGLVRGVAGATILGDGRVALILDIGSLVAHEDVSAALAAVPSHAG